MAVGFDCIIVTPPSTGTTTETLFNGTGDDMQSQLYL